MLRIIRNGYVAHNGSFIHLSARLRCCSSWAPFVRSATSGSEWSLGPSIEPLNLFLSRVRFSGIPAEWPVHNQRISVNSDKSDPFFGMIKCRFIFLHLERVIWMQLASDAFLKSFRELRSESKWSLCPGRRVALVGLRFGSSDLKFKHGNFSL